MAYSNELALKKFTDDVRALVQSHLIADPAAKTRSAKAFDLVARLVRDGSDSVAAMEVRAEISAEAGASSATFSLRAPTLWGGSQGLADLIDSLQVRDATGQVSLRLDDDPLDLSGYTSFRHWRAERPVRYPVSISYRVRIFPAGGRPGPGWGLRAIGGGVTGSGTAFIVVPEDSGATYSSRFHWDLTSLAPGSIGVSTFGDGDFELSGSAGQSLSGWYLAGPVGRYPERGDVEGFSANWLGSPSWDIAGQMSWAARMYTYLRKFYGDVSSGSTRYRMFMKVLPPPARGGTALGNSFMLSVNDSMADSALLRQRHTIAHEMGHQWVGGIQGESSSRSFATNWFAEGLNDYYTNLLIMRAAMQSVESYARAVNRSAEGYYKSPARNLTADSIGRAGFANQAAQNSQYARGVLFWADLEGRIRTASKGRHKLDDVLLPLFDRRKRGARLTVDSIVVALAKEIGSAARAQCEAVILRGETIVPVSNAFGPCLNVVRQSMRWPRAVKWTATSGCVCRPFLKSSARNGRLNHLVSGVMRKFFCHSERSEES